MKVSQYLSSNMTFTIAPLLFLLQVLFMYVALAENSSSNNNHKLPSLPTRKHVPVPPSQTAAPAPRKSTNNSFFKINPKSIMKTICKYGGIVLPKSIENDIKIINDTCDCEETTLDLIQKQLEIFNFTLCLPPNKVSDNNNKNKPALRIGRIFIQWDNYLKPCLEIEVDDVDVLVEFVNVFLTKNNWNELQDAGFPPSFYDYLDTDTNIMNNNNIELSKTKPFLTIGSINLTGKVILKIHSRPLQQEIINDIEFNLSTLHDLNKHIQSESQKALIQTGRKGCSTDVLCSIVQSYFSSVVKQSLKQTALDTTFNTLLKNNNDNSATRAVVNEEKVKNVLLNSKETLLRYAKGLGDKTNKDLEQKIIDFGVRPDHFDLAKSMVKTLLSNSDDDDDDDHSSQNDDKGNDNIDHT